MKLLPVASGGEARHLSPRCQARGLLGSAAVLATETGQAAGTIISLPKQTLMTSGAAEPQSQVRDRHFSQADRLSEISIRPNPSSGSTAAGFQRRKIKLPSNMQMASGWLDQLLQDSGMHRCEGLNELF